MKDNPRITKKERGLLKGALRRVFSRSELRRKVVDASIIEHRDSTRPRVTKWCRCAVCLTPTARYQTVADHIMPVIPIYTTFEEMGLDLTADRLWCEEQNLQPICIACHKAKSRQETKERKLRKNKK